MTELYLLPKALEHVNGFGEYPQFVYVCSFQVEQFAELSEPAINMRRKKIFRWLNEP